MNIKKAEELSGVSRQNIRYYEREGLLHPERNPENDYREYGEDHIRTLKQIRAMRMLDMPLDTIKLVLDGKLSPGAAAAQQQRKLKEQQTQLAAAIRFCEGRWRSPPGHFPAGKPRRWRHDCRHRPHPAPRRNRRKPDRRFWNAW